VGSNPHIIGEMFKHRFNIDIVHVPYKGGGAGVIDVVSGQIEMCVLGSSGAAPRVRAGQLRGLAVTSGSRSPLIPEVPTMAEAGVSDFVLGPLFLLVAPAGTPADIVNALNAVAVKAVQKDDFRARLAQLGADPLAESPDYFRKMLAAEIERWGTVVRASKAKPE
jgi:tripartite-type tricarboxylate transporter receptor subunit TctC